MTTTDAVISRFGIEFTLWERLVLLFRGHVHLVVAVPTERQVGETGPAEVAVRIASNRRGHAMAKPVSAPVPPSYPTTSKPFNPPQPVHGPKGNP